MGATLPRTLRPRSLRGRHGYVEGTFKVHIPPRGLTFYLDFRLLRHYVPRNDGGLAPLVSGVPSTDGAMTGYKRRRGGSILGTVLALNLERFHAAIQTCPRDITMRVL